MAYDKSKRNRPLKAVSGLHLITETFDPDVLSHLNTMFDELRIRDDVSSASAVASVDVVSELTSSLGDENGADFLMCSSVTMHDDDQVGWRWSHLICLGPVDGNDEVEHVLHMLPVKPGWDLIQSWNHAKSLPAEVAALCQQVVLRPGSVVAFENACPHWMTWSDGDARMDDLYEPPPSDEELVRSPEAARAAALAMDNPDRYVAKFVSVASDHLLNLDEVVKIARSTSVWKASPGPSR